MSVPVYDPKISVVLKKNIGRSVLADGVAASERFKGTNRSIDLTPFLGENGSVTVSKSVRDPAGMFAVALTDALAVGNDSLYGLIEPMDVIEVRMARDASQYASSGFEQSMPIMMRGFVSDVARDRQMTDQGPVRSISITGQDYGKILQIIQFYFLPFIDPGSKLTTFFKFFENYTSANPESQVLQPASKFVEGIVNDVINPFLSDMQSDPASGASENNASPVRPLGVEATVTDGVISGYGTNVWASSGGGSAYSLLSMFCDIGAWNELFIEDRDNGPFLIYRPTPFKDATGAFIQDGATADSTSLTDKDIVGITQRRSDSGVYNYYWVDSPRFSLIDGKQIQQGIVQGSVAGTFFIGNYQNSSSHLYGFRPLIAQTNEGARFDGQKEQDLNEGVAEIQAFINRRRDVLMKNNRDNVIFESGSMLLKGNEKIRAGQILKMTEGKGGMESECYAYSVVQQFLPFRKYETTVNFERGTGFIARAVREGGASSPYFSEMDVGGVYS